MNPAGFSLPQLNKQADSCIDYNHKNPMIWVIFCP